MEFTSLLLNYPVQTYVFFLVLLIIIEICYLYDMNTKQKKLYEELAKIKRENNEKINEFYSLLT